MDPAAIDHLRAAAVEAVAGGLPSLQIALARDGEVVLHEAFGAATTEDRYVTFSVSKAVTGAAAWLAVGDGAIAYGDRVSDHVPEFASNGKDAVTVEHLLLHTAGFPNAPINHDDARTREGRVRRYASWRLDTEPGTAYAYHHTAAHWVLRDVLEAATGVALPEFIRDRLAAPLGLDAVVLGDGPRVRPLEVVGHAAAGQIVGGVDIDAIVGEAGHEHMLRFNEPDVRALGSPGAGIVASAGDIAAFYQALLHGGPWDPDVLADATGTVRNDLRDPFLPITANRTRGLALAGAGDAASVRGFCRAVSPETFGAPGVGGQVAWADPRSGLSFCTLTNGVDGDLVRAWARSVELSTRAAACVS